MGGFGIKQVIKAVAFSLRLHAGNSAVATRFRQAGVSFLKRNWIAREKRERARNELLEKHHAVTLRVSARVVGKPSLFVCFAYFAGSIAVCMFILER